MYLPDFFTYNDEYDEENYLYDEDTEDLDIEEISTTFLPVFTSSPTVYRVTEGHTARLEGFCIYFQQKSEFENVITEV